MSVGPAAFEALRKATYVYWSGCAPEERERAALQSWCAQRLSEWRSAHPEGKDLSEADLRSIASGVAHWVVDNYKPPRRARPRTTREQRTAEAISLGTACVDWVKDRGLKPSARNVAASVGVSKSKAARAIAHQRGAPKRQKLIEALSPRARDVLTLIELMLPGDGQVPLRLDEVVGKLWSGGASAATLRQHRARLRRALAELAPLGVHVAEAKGLLAVRRGRRWRKGEEGSLIESALERPGRICPAPDLPSPVTNLFWTSMEVRTLLAVIKVALGCETQEEFRRFLIMLRPLIDLNPVDRAWLLCKRDGLDVVEGFHARAVLPKINPDTARALHRTASVMTMLREDGRWGRPACDAVGYALRESRYVESIDDAGRERLHAFLQLVDVRDDADQWIGVFEAHELCTNLADAEVRGDWTWERDGRRAALEFCPF